MKQIAIIGATGSTGKEVVRLALEANYKVTIVVRNPDKIQPQNNVTVLKGDVTDLESIELAFKNIDYVISCFGPANNRKINGLLSTGASNIVKACEKNNVKRFIFMSGAAQANYSELSLGAMPIMPLLRLIYSESYHDKVIAETSIQNSKLEWVIVRATGLNNAQPTGKYVAGIKNKIHLAMLPYADCAKCLLDAIDKKKWTRQIIHVGKR